jgi:hypothetical protein
MDMARRELTAIVRLPRGIDEAREALTFGRADVYADNAQLAYRIADELPGHGSGRPLQLGADVFRRTKKQCGGTFQPERFYPQS